MNAPARRIRRTVLGAVAASFFAANAALAQGDAGRDYVFLAMVADRGVNCGLMRDWEVASLLSQLERIIQNFSPADQQILGQTAAQQAAQTLCDDPVIGQWIVAARPGMVTE